MKLRVFSSKQQAQEKLDELYEELEVITKSDEIAWDSGLYSSLIMAKKAMMLAILHISEIKIPNE